MFAVSGLVFFTLYTWSEGGVKDGSLCRTRVTPAARIAATKRTTNCRTPLKAKKLDAVVM